MQFFPRVPGFDYKLTGAKIVQKLDKTDWGVVKYKKQPIREHQRAALVELTMICFIQLHAKINKNKQTRKIEDVFQQCYEGASTATPLT